MVMRESNDDEPCLGYKDVQDFDWRKEVIHAIPSGGMPQNVFPCSDG
jgi:hypothetical protein